MAFRELHMVEIKEVLRLWSRGHGLRTVASRAGVDRKTARRYIEAARRAGLERGASSVEDGRLAEVAAAVRPGASPEIGRMRDHLRANSEAIRGWVDEGCRGPKLARLVLRTTGIPVPLRTLQRFVAEDLGVERGQGDTVRVVDPDPGVLEVDFLTLGTFTEIGTGARRTLHAVLCTASYSRHQFLWPCLRQAQDDLVEALEAAWAFFGGVFPVVLPDNASAIVRKADPVAPQFTEGFLEYAQSRGFEIDPARVRRARDKPRVERQVRFSRDDFFRGERFRSLEEARLAARGWCTREAGERTHGRTRRRPVEVFDAEEKARLLPAPTGAYDQPRWSDHHAGRDHAVVVDQALYSVPYTLGECDLRARRDRATVKLYLGARLVKVHPRQPPGGTRIDAADLPPGKAALATRDASSLCAQGEHFGPRVGEYARRLADGPLPWSRIRHVYRLLGLARRFGGAATDEACARALELDVVDVSRVQAMLEKGLERRKLLSSSPPPPVPTGTVLRFARDAREFRRGGSDAPA
ncbi:MAG: IS21 family transposase [Deltaproteobacteria bacterium]|nr:IS21 family transposase [Deltaproteobacteria bacterium]